MEWLLCTLKSFNTVIEFTLKMSDNRMNYLDLSITRVDHENILLALFCIYRNHSFTGVYDDLLHPDELQDGGDQY